MKWDVGQRGRVRQEFTFAPALTVRLPLLDETQTMSQLMAAALNAFENAHPLKRLRANNAQHYELRCLDEGDLDEDDLELPMGHKAKICDLIDRDLARRKAVPVAMCLIIVASSASPKSVRFGSRSPTMTRYDDSEANDQMAEQADAAPRTPRLYC